MDYSFNPRLSICLSESEFKLQEIIKILNTPPHQRSQNAIRTLQYHTQPISLFNQSTEEYDESIFKECCQSLRYSFNPADSIVFQVGDKGEFFYLILEGEVSISVFNEEKKKLEGVCTLGIGGAFGELALIRDQPRSATIKCIKDTHFATLCKTDYLRVLGCISTKRLEELVTLFSSLPTFSGWSKRSLIKLSYYFRQVKFKRNQLIFNEKDPAESVFIVKKGEVEIIKNINVQRPNIRKIGNDGRPVPVMKSGNFSMKAKVSIQGIGEIIGDDDVIHDLPRSFTCQCYSSTAELLEISKSEFKKRIRAEDSLNQLTERQRMKDSHMSSAISLFKLIKQPETVQETPRHKAGKELLDSIRSMNPWSSAQSLFTRKALSSHQTKAVIIKQAIRSVAKTSLQLTPKIPSCSSGLKSYQKTPTSMMY